MAYQFDVKLTTPFYTLGIDAEEMYGYFEHNTVGEDKSGGLWFVKLGSSLELVDYDGPCVNGLPTQVFDALVAYGCSVDQDYHI